MACNHCLAVVMTKNVHYFNSMTFFLGFLENVFYFLRFGRHCGIIVNRSTMLLCHRVIYLTVRLLSLLDSFIHSAFLCVWVSFGVDRFWCVFVWTIDFIFWCIFSLHSLTQYFLFVNETKNLNENLLFTLLINFKTLLFFCL